MKSFRGGLAGRSTTRSEATLKERTATGNSASASTSASIAASNFFDDIASFQMSGRHYGKGSGGLADLTPVARHLGENGL